MSLPRSNRARFPDQKDSSYPFWSPDSTFIGFFQGGKLRKIAAAGGPAQDDLRCRGFAGRRVGPGWHDSLYRRSGKAYFSCAFGWRQAGATDHAHRRRSKRRPSSAEFLPDGQHFLFNATREQQRQRGDSPGVVGWKRANAAAAGRCQRYFRSRYWSVSRGRVSLLRARRDAHGSSV